jgi:non-ribosomal peptide synthetase component F
LKEASPNLFYLDPLLLLLLTLGTTMVKVYNDAGALGKLSPTDQNLFHTFGDGLRIDPPFSLIHSAFESIADSQPLSPAVEHDGIIMSYREIEEAANILANKLIVKGLRPRRRVCLVVQRSTFMVIAILAILKCGCQYVPIDGGVIPEHSLRHIFRDTEASFILCLEKFLNRVQQVACPESCIIALDNAKATDLDLPTMRMRPKVSVESCDGAYIIYTSGENLA